MFKRVNPIPSFIVVFLTCLIWIAFPRSQAQMQTARETPAPSLDGMSSVQATATALYLTIFGANATQTMQLESATLTAENLPESGEFWNRLESENVVLGVTPSWISLKLDIDELLEQ